MFLSIQFCYVSNFLLILLESDIVCFLTGLLLGGDLNARSWLSQFVRAGQKRGTSCLALTRLRLELTRRLGRLLATCGDSQASLLTTDVRLVQKVAN